MEKTHFSKKYLIVNEVLNAVTHGIGAGLSIAGLVIAGSYTPFCLISIGGWLGWTLFSLVWLIAIVGIVYKSLTLHKQETVKNISTIIYIVLGWLCIIAARPLYESLGFTGTALLVAGGVSYTLGAAFYSLKNVRFMHVVWHLFVMLAAILMYFSVLFYT